MAEEKNYETGTNPSGGGLPQKVELVINRQEEKASQEVTINLMNVFRNMKKSKKLYLRVIAVCLLLGIIVPLVLYQMDDTETSAAAVLTFKGASGEYSYGSFPYDVSEIKSEYVLKKVLENVSLSKGLSVAMISNNIGIEQLLTSDTRQDFANRTALAEDATDASKVWDGFTLKYSNQFVITLSNGFTTGAEGEKPVYIRTSELTELLGAIVNSYNDFLYESYGDYRMPENILETVDYESTEYSDILDNIGDEISTLVSYCNSKSGSYPDFTSKDNGLTFAEVATYIGLIRDADYTVLQSYLYSNGLAKNKQTLEDKYNYRLRTDKLQLTEINEKIESVDSSIAQYKRDRIIVSSSESAESKEAYITTNYYNSLVMQKLELTEQLHSTETDIADMTDRLEKLAAITSSSNTDSEFDAKLLKCFNNLKDMYAIVYDLAEELFERGFVKCAYIDVAYSTVSSDGSGDGVTNISGSSTNEVSIVKNVGIGAVIGVVIAVVIWACDGLVLELKESNADKKEKEENT